MRQQRNLGRGNLGGGLDKQTRLQDLHEQARKYAVPHRRVDKSQSRRADCTSREESQHRERERGMRVVGT